MMTVPRSAPAIVAGVPPLRHSARRADTTAMAAPTYWTADMVRALPDDGNRYETVHGELLVSPAPRAWHQEVLKRILVSLDAYLTAHPVGHLFASPADISWSDVTLVQPDLFVVPLEEARTLDWAQIKDLRLVIEVLSPSTARHDCFTKRRLYQDVGIPLYWIVDADAHTVEVWTPAARFPTVERERVTWEPVGGPPVTLELGEVFREM
jgi:Uma2 family endonuclease